MQRHYPLDPATGLENPALAWTDGVPASGIEGAYPGHLLVTNPQEELLALIAEAALAPSDADLFQILKAIRSGRLTTFPDTSTTANAITIAPNTAHSALFKGLPFRIWPANTNTSATVTLAVSAVPAVRLKKRDGASDPAVGDIVAGVPLDVVCDGALFRVISPLPSESLTPPTGASTQKAPFLCVLEASQAANVSAPTSTDTIIPYSTLIKNSFGTSTWNNQRLTIGAGEAGFLLVTGGVSFSTPVSNIFVAGRIKKNGVIVGEDGDDGVKNGDGVIRQPFAAISVAQNDYIEIWANQQSGSAQPFVTDTGYGRTRFLAMLVSSYLP